MEINELTTRARKIRTAYHELEIKQDGQPWTTEQDALAFLTDAGLVGRLVMAQQGSWPAAQSEFSLDYKIAESIWWLSVLADANDIDMTVALENFLQSREQHLK
ncbi:30S ribosomal protein S15 [Loigolactobacillus backii]|uniref:MazG-like protein n=1 Tax=Loigolactobacillus backii TaxID=375175 RepID=UPI000C1C9C81|nr:MazG-like protein [Loigolactobacillus backii]PIO83171.1 30S ribosomal protein S15 [Loigolactobacillus backii]